MKRIFATMLFILLMITNLGITSCIAQQQQSDSKDKLTPITRQSQQEERRAYDRYTNRLLVKPVKIESLESSNVSLIDISRGGVGIKHHNTLHEGDIIPIKITYNDIVIDTEVRIVSATDERAGAEYINTNKGIINKLLYLSIVLEADNNLLKTKLSV